MIDISELDRDEAYLESVRSVMPPDFYAKQKRLIALKRRHARRPIPCAESIDIDDFADETLLHFMLVDVSSFTVRLDRELLCQTAVDTLVALNPRLP